MGRRPIILAIVIYFIQIAIILASPEHANNVEKYNNEDVPMSEELNILLDKGMIETAFEKIHAAEMSLGNTPKTAEEGGEWLKIAGGYQLLRDQEEALRVLRKIDAVAVNNISEENDDKSNEKWAALLSVARYSTAKSEQELGQYDAASRSMLSALYVLEKGYVEGARELSLNYQVALIELYHAAGDIDGAADVAENILRQLDGIFVSIQEWDWQYHLIVDAIYASQRWYVLINYWPFLKSKTIGGKGNIANKCRIAWLVSSAFSYMEMYEEAGRALALCAGKQEYIKEKKTDIARTTLTMMAANDIAEGNIESARKHINQLRESIPVADHKHIQSMLSLALIEAKYAHAFNIKNKGHSILSEFYKRTLWYKLDPGLAIDLLLQLSSVANDIGYPELALKAMQETAQSILNSSGMSDIYSVYIAISIAASMVDLGKYAIAKQQLNYVINHANPSEWHSVIVSVAVQEARILKGNNEIPQLSAVAQMALDQLPLDAKSRRTIESLLDNARSHDDEYVPLFKQWLNKNCVTSYCKSRAWPVSECTISGLTETEVLYEQMDGYLSRYEVDSAVRALEEKIEKIISCSNSDASSPSTELLFLSKIYQRSNLDTLANMIAIKAWQHLPMPDGKWTRTASDIAGMLARQASINKNLDEEFFWLGMELDIYTQRIGASSRRAMKQRLEMLQPKYDKQLQGKIDTLRDEFVYATRSASMAVLVEILDILQARVDKPGPQSLRAALFVLAQEVEQTITSSVLRNKEKIKQKEIEKLFDDYSMASTLLKASYDAYIYCSSRLITIYTLKASDASSTLSVKEIRRIVTAIEVSQNSSDSTLGAHLVNSARPLFKTIKNYPELYSRVLVGAATLEIKSWHSEHVFQSIEYYLSQLSDVDADITALYLDQLVSQIILFAYQSAAKANIDAALTLLDQVILVLGEGSQLHYGVLMRLQLVKNSLVKCTQEENTWETLYDYAGKSLDSAHSNEDLPYENILSVLRKTLDDRLYESGLSLAQALQKWEAKYGRPDPDLDVYEMASIMRNIYAANAHYYALNGESELSRIYRNKIIDVWGWTGLSNGGALGPSASLRWEALLTLKLSKYDQSRALYKQVLQQLTNESAYPIEADIATLEAILGLLFLKHGARHQAQEFFDDSRAHVAKDETSLGAGDSIITALSAVLAKSNDVSIERLRGAVDTNDALIQEEEQLLFQLLRPELSAAALLPPGIQLSSLIGHSRLWLINNELLIDYISRELIGRRTEATVLSEEAFFIMQNLLASGTMRTAVLSKTLGDSDSEGSMIAQKAAVTIAARNWTRRRKLAIIGNEFDLMEPVSYSCDAIGEHVQKYSDWLHGRSNKDDIEPEQISNILTGLEKEPDLASLSANVADESAKFLISRWPTPAKLTATIDKLSTKSALLLMYSAEEATYLMLVTKSGGILRKVPITKSSLDMRVSLLLRGVADERKNLPIYPLRVAFELYMDIFGVFSDELENIKDLSVYGAGPLMRLPLALLVTEKPDTLSYQTKDHEYQAYKNAAWFDKKYTVRNIASLVIDGVEDVSATDTTIETVASSLILLAAPSLNASKECSSTMTHSTFHNKTVSDLCDIPGTDEFIIRLLRRVGMSQATIKSCMPDQASSDNVVLCITGDSFTEKSINTITNRIGSKTTLVFATHGLLARETASMNGMLEPALVTTPEMPQSDGLLTLSEITSLSLPARLIVITACNTAHPDIGDYSDINSGLAQAFLLAGAQAVMTTHWAIYSKPALDFTEYALEQLMVNEHNNAKALQLAMRNVRESAFDTRPPEFSHPRFWGFFSVLERDLRPVQH